MSSRLIVLGAAGLMAGALACAEKKDAPAAAAGQPASAASATAPAPTPAPAAAAPAAAAAVELPVPADFEEKAAKEITPDNYKDALDGLAAEIEAE